METVAQHEAVYLLRRERQRPPHHTRGDSGGGKNAPERARAQRGGGVRLAAEQAEVDEHVRETVVRQEGERPGIAAHVVLGRRSHAVLRRVHAGRRRGPHGIGAGRPQRGEVHRRTALEKPRKVRQSAAGGTRQDVVERRAVEQQHHDARARDRERVRGERGRQRYRRDRHAWSAGRNRKGQRAEHGDRQQRGADAAAAAAEGIVCRRQPQQDDGRRRRRGRAGRHAPDRCFAERGRKPADVEPHQHRGHCRRSTPSATQGRGHSPIRATRGREPMNSRPTISR